MNFGNKEANDKTWPFNTVTTQADHQMKDFQHIIIFGANYIPLSGQC
jgi:hypothetical protein